MGDLLKPEEMVQSIAGMAVFLVDAADATTNSRLVDLSMQSAALSGAFARLRVCLKCRTGVK